jgi:hypothetical protein
MSERVPACDGPPIVGGRYQEPFGEMSISRPVSRNDIESIRPGRTLDH